MLQLKVLIISENTKSKIKLYQKPNADNIHFILV